MEVWSPTGESPGVADVSGQEPGDRCAAAAQDRRPIGSGIDQHDRGGGWAEERFDAMFSAHEMQDESVAHDVFMLPTERTQGVTHRLGAQDVMWFQCTENRSVLVADRARRSEAD